MTCSPLQSFMQRRGIFCYTIGMQSNYEKSNAIFTIDFSVSRRAQKIANALLRPSPRPSPLRGEGIVELRQKLGDALLDELADCAEIDIVNLKISPAKQFHKKRGGRTVFKQYGYYRPASKYIYITNFTAVRGKPLAPKTFLTTLLHEWMHHYDYCKLKLNSIHTRGFYERLRSLQEALLS